MKKIIIIILLVFLFPVFSVYAQKTGEVTPEYNPDTVFVFNSPRPLVRKAPSEMVYDKGVGFHLLLSGNGYGLGFFYTKHITKSLNAFASLYLSGARNTDEFEYYDPQTGQIIIPGKKNRLYLLPLMFGLNYYMLRDVLSKSFQPYLGFGVGPTFILVNPYEKEFFQAIGYTRLKIRFGSFIGLGADVTANPKTILGIDLRYYYIPYGGNGLESIEGMPIYDFGGLFLSLNFGWKF